MIRIVFLIILILSLLTTPLFAEDIKTDSSVPIVIKLRGEYIELFEKLPVNTNMAVQDFIDGFTTFEETKYRLEAMKPLIYGGGCGLSKFNEN
ncbi:MAG: hypothetical protein HZA00_01665 [Nitrospinae bacterium]|nr:hypothetical protein [Nitrospinota bacterium]